MGGLNSKASDQEMLCLSAIEGSTVLLGLAAERLTSGVCHNHYSTALRLPEEGTNYQDMDDYSLVLTNPAICCILVTGGSAVEAQCCICLTADLNV